MYRFLRWLKPKYQNRNLISSVCNMFIITLVSMSLVGLNWFVISEKVCTPNIPLMQRIIFGLPDYDSYRLVYNCYTTTMVNFVRVIILFCTMIIIFALIGFFIDILAPINKPCFFARKYNVLGSCTLLWVMLITMCSYYTLVLLEDTLANLYPEILPSVHLGAGFFLVIAAGVISFANIFHTLIVAPPLVQHRGDERHLIGSTNRLLSFDSYELPPPYIVPPPPYTP